MNDVRSFKAKNRMFKFDYKKMNTFNGQKDFRVPSRYV